MDEHDRLRIPNGQQFRYAGTWLQLRQNLLRVKLHHISFT